MWNELIATWLLIAFVIVVSRVISAAWPLALAGVAMVMAPPVLVATYFLLRFIFTAGYLAVRTIGKGMGQLYRKLSNREKKAGVKDKEGKKVTAEYKNGLKDSIKGREDIEKSANLEESEQTQESEILETIGALEDGDEKSELVGSLEDLKRKDDFVKQCGGKNFALNEIHKGLNGKLRRRKGNSIPLLS